MLSKNTSKRSNHNFFTIQTPQSAYLMGLLEADGCIRDNKRIAYSAAEKDRQLVIDTHALLETNVTISCSTWKIFKKYRWTVTSPQIIADLKRDRFRSGYLPQLNEVLIPHWLRGLFDGDGSIFLSKQAKGYCSNIVFSSESLAKAVSDYLKQNSINNNGPYLKTSSKHCWYINMGKTSTVKLGELMQVDSPLGLARKREKFLLARKERK